MTYEEFKLQEDTKQLKQYYEAEMRAVTISNKAFLRSLVLTNVGIGWLFPFKINK